MSHPANRILSTEAMTAIFGPEATVESMLVFEGALSRAEAKTGLIPAKARRFRNGCHNVRRAIIEITKADHSSRIECHNMLVAWPQRDAPHRTFVILK